jgi:hypothetical protein
MSDLVKRVTFYSVDNSLNIHFVDTIDGINSPSCICGKKFDEMFSLEEIVDNLNDNFNKFKKIEGICRKCIEILENTHF